jgi:cellulose synthase/poly-beta-1,6-N-acetylglucosamine synthase-like glycosyltransferase
VTPLRFVFWGSAGLIAWTHVGYPLAAAALARLRPRPVNREDGSPRVTVVVAAHNEEAVIERRLENLLAVDYPSDRVEFVVASDASEDRTDELVEAIAAKEPRVRLRRCPRGGKVAAQNLAVRDADSEVVAFSDANSTWETDALAKLVRSFADPDVAYVCGALRLREATGTNREGMYWRYELWLRELESKIGSITGGNGSIYAVRRSDWIEVDPRYGHDGFLPYALVQRGRRAVYDPDAVAWEKPATDTEDEFRRKVRMFDHAWLMVFEGRVFERLGPLYALEMLSHRYLRYGSGLLHLALLGSSLALARRGGAYRSALALQLAILALAGAGRARVPIPGAGLALYYTFVTWATVVSLVRYLRFGVPPVWEKAEGTR